MPTFLFLNFLFLIHPAFQISDSDTFLIYNENLHLCLKLQESRSFTFEICDKFNEWQNFKWVSDYQLLNMAVKLCLSVPSNSSMVSVTLSPCNETIELQKWECRNNTLLALVKQDLFLNPANGHENGIILSENHSAKSVWKIYGTKKSLCDQKYEALFTIEGNSLGAPCVFPFKYMNKWHAKCIVDDEHEQFWCGTTSDVDKDSLTGYCPIKDENNDFFWIKNHWTGDLYQINFLSALTWNQARKSCQQQHSELLSINELYEQGYLAGLTSNFEANYWIGLNNPDFDSGWQWINDQPLRYLNWAPGSPSSETGKNCGLMQGRNGKWANNLCEQKCGYICKRMNSSKQASAPSSDDLKPIKCPDGWVGYAKHCYRLNRDRKTWKGASVSCQKDGGHLLSIHDIEEYSFVFSQLGYESTDNLWIGLNDQKVSSYFEWSDGTTVSFIKWQKGEPTLISNVEEDCIIMTGKNGYWADHFCEEELGYICKKEPSEFLPGTDEVADPKCQKGWKRYGFYCYLIGKTPGTFSEAKKLCETNQGFLISVENRFEQAFLTSQIGHRPEKYFWIGLSDVENPGTFNWTNGDPIQFTHWNAKMPGPDPGCVAMRTGDAAGLWDVVNCEERVPFLCKHLAEGVTPPPILRTSPPPPCPEGWSASPTRNVCFKAYIGKKVERKTWYEAYDFCKQIGGDLASFHNKLEEHLLNQLSQSESAWIGLRISDSSTGYTWTDGSPVNYEPTFTLSSNENNKCRALWRYIGAWRAAVCYQFFDWFCQITRGSPLNPEPSNKFDYTYKNIEDGWIEFENNEYYFSNTTMPAEKARKFCKQHHGDLTTIESQKEKMFLWKYAINYGIYQDSYIGLILSLDKKFGWMDGTPVTYEAWAPGEPNFANEDEHCVVMYYDSGVWNDINCGAQKSFICERHNSSVRTTAAPTLPANPKGCSEGWLWFDDKCFQIFGFKEEEKKNWSAARDHCRNLEGNLASIPNKAVQAFLTVQLKSVSGNTWTGLTDKNWNGRFLWTDGSGVYFTNWAKGAPSLIDGDCVFMVTKPERLAGYWRIGSCSSKMTYICQKNTGPEPYSEPTVPASHYISYGNSSYSMVSPKMTWEEARKKCESENSKLATISDPYTESFIWLQVFRYKEPVWIGLSSKDSDSRYKWVSNWRLAYTKWAAGEPLHKTACVYLDTDGFWKTGNCSEKYFSVCERYYGVVPTEIPQLPGKCQTSKNNRISWIPFRGHCYKIYLTMETWPAASVICSHIGGTLASIEDSTELQFLQEEMEKFRYKAFWIGLFKNLDGEWIWQDKSKVTFVNWNEQQLRNSLHLDREEDIDLFLDMCVYMDSYSGLWFTGNCGGYQSKPFICKRNKIIEESTIKPTEISVQKRVASLSTHGTAVGVVLPIIFIVIGAGIAAYIFYRRRNRQQQVSAGFDNSLYSDNAVILHKDSQSLVDNQELN
ncbi:macrophage mannose receptor 1-like isoform X1 [Pantherophis guttatus]|uniref:Macrophage mannose receptor 1-like isoform X1 n=2 Tax=Pantherophis guttatus TaxID=94885 RepID=A0A6P9AH84_PANGU|nr:macrophage mannose receptor 1-like isoform X1 [Pantherophis guttatus]